MNGSATSIWQGRKPTPKHKPIMSLDIQNKAGHDVSGEIAQNCLLTCTRQISRVLTAIYDEALRPFGINASQFSLLVLIVALGPRNALVKAVTEAVARAENRPFDEVSPRVWVFPTEIPDGTWGSRGAIWTLSDIHAILAGESERSVGEDRLARRRREKARITLVAAVDAASVATSMS